QRGGSPRPPSAAPRGGRRAPAPPGATAAGQIVAAEGARVPDARTSPKTFRIGFIFLTRPGVDPDPEDLAAVERIREAFAGHFFALTRGIGIADTTLVEEPGLPPAVAPDLQHAREWLLAQQSPDGSWQDSPATAVRDTPAVL